MVINLSILSDLFVLVILFLVVFTGGKASF